MSRVKRAFVVVAALAAALGLAGSASAQSVTLCTKGKVSLGGEALLDLDECHSLP